jgi:glyceraldehyde-3-phosphate dehydrogenase/erythrose-4-phosphate dehydrogenase
MKSGPDPIENDRIYRSDHLTWVEPFISAEYMVYQLKHDQIHGQWRVKVSHKDGKLYVNEKRIRLFTA